jgi:acylphosphatase
MTGRTSRRCFVSGRVQGVYFRASTAACARQLGVTGYARNLDDGRVEVLACGEEAAVAALCEWLWEGPRRARVTDVSVEVVSVDPPADFTEG